MEIPDTSAYMIAGYIVIFGILALYIISLALRWRHLRKEIQTFENDQVE